MPAQERLGLDEETTPMSPRQQTAQSGQQGPVGRLECRADDLATQHGHLVAQHDDLGRRLLSVPASETEQREDPDEGHIEKGQRHEQSSPEGADLRKSQVEPPDGFSARTALIYECECECERAA